MTNAKEEAFLSSNLSNEALASQARVQIGFQLTMAKEKPKIKPNGRSKN